MRNQIQADFYKLTHSLLFKVITGIMIVFLIVFMALSGDEEGITMGLIKDGAYVGKEPILQGFMMFAYEDVKNPTSWEIIYTAVGMSFVIWIIQVTFVILNFSKDFTNGTIRLSFARGDNRYVLFLSKFIVLTISFGIMYYLFNIITYLFTLHSVAQAVTVEGFLNMLQLTTLYFLALSVLTLISMVLFCFTQNSTVTITISIAYMLVSFFVILGQMGNEPTGLVKVFLYISPMYYLWMDGTYWANSSIIIQTILYFIISFVVLNFLGYYALKNKEIK